MYIYYQYTHINYIHISIIQDTQGVKALVLMRYSINVCRLQAYWRVGLAKRVSRGLRRERGAVLLQALVRGYRVRRRLRFTRQRHAAKHHATTIQRYGTQRASVRGLHWLGLIGIGCGFCVCLRVFRGFYARKALRALRAFRRRKARTIWYVLTHSHST
jgi:hypothetical protein